MDSSLLAQWHRRIAVAGSFLEVIISLPYRWSFVQRQFTLSAAYCMGGTDVKLGAGLCPERCLPPSWRANKSDCTQGGEAGSVVICWDGSETGGEGIESALTNRFPVE